mmetsp:Transcript_37648/g.67468  ORF Transcript_37648/g.67468 Transcript_37648/m.67468 type:complete len:167 (-) Transcript_37648:1452-1952(-)
MGDSWEDLDEQEVRLPGVESAAKTERIVPQADGVDDGEEGWEVRRPPLSSVSKTYSSGKTSAPASTAAGKEKLSADDRPLLLVDLTVLSGGALHNKFDKASCNDADLKREWIRKVEADYTEYERNAELISAGTVRSCGASVWREALTQLRDDHPGHFWAPVFPPTK